MSTMPEAYGACLGTWEDMKEGHQGQEETWGEGCIPYLHCKDNFM